MGASISTHGAITLRRPKQHDISSAWKEDTEIEQNVDNLPNFSVERRPRPPQKRRRIVINVSGFRYMTYVKTLERFPLTLLGSSEKRAQYYDEELDEYFFDRNIQVFELILYFYQSNGRLICPSELAPEILLEEVEFFELGEQAVSAIKEILSEEDQVTELAEMPTNKAQRWIWKLFEYPDSSKAARLIALLSVMVIVASIFLLCIETLPVFTILSEDRISANDSGKLQEVRDHNNYATSVRAVFAYLEMAFISWFTFEYFVRLLSSPAKWRFIRSFLNIIDLLAILPFYVELGLKNSEQNFSLAFLRILRLVRVFRIFKLSRHSSGLQILGLTLKKSLRELALLIFFLAIGVIIFSSMVYYAESGVEDTKFESIPGAFWWAVVTMTTVGYGDMYPTTLWGKLVGSGCALIGVLTIALPVPVIVSNFDAIYKKHRSHKLKQQGQLDVEDDKARKSSIMLPSISRMTSDTVGSCDPLSNVAPLMTPNAADDITAKDAFDKLNGNLIRQGQQPLEEFRLSNGNRNKSQERDLDSTGVEPEESSFLLVHDNTDEEKPEQTCV